MAKTDYYPRPDGELLIWHDRFKTNLAEHINTLGLSSEELSIIEKDNQLLHAKIAASDAANAAARHATADKVAIRTEIENRIRALVRRIKSHPAYTQAIGILLGIIGSENNTNLTLSKPVLTASDQTGGIVVVNFVKSKSDGVNIYCQRDGDTELTFLARDTVPPYVDNRPLLVAGKPELRRYSAVYVLNDAEVSQFSDELVVTCAP